MLDEREIAAVVDMLRACSTFRSFLEATVTAANAGVPLLMTDQHRTALLTASAVMKRGFEALEPQLQGELARELRERVQEQTREKPGLRLV